MAKNKTRAQLIEIHKALHGSLDTLLACYLESNTHKRLISTTTLMEFIEWSHEQTKEPSCYKS